MAKIVPFPARPAIPALPDFCSEIEEARHMVARLRAQRDAYAPSTRKFMIEQIKLDWWMEELLRVSVDADSSVIAMRRLAQ